VVLLCKIQTYSRIWCECYIKIHSFSSSFCSHPDKSAILQNLDLEHDLSLAPTLSISITEMASSYGVEREQDRKDGSRNAVCRCKGIRSRITLSRFHVLGLSLAVLRVRYPGGAVGASAW
jgi:hypothetical protein